MLWAALISGVCYACRFLTGGGALAAALVGGLAWEAGRLPFAAPLLAFFASSTALGALGRAQQPETGPRTAAQVLANGGPAALCSLLYLGTLHSPFASAMIASLAAANADTWATEIGTAFGKRPFRITNLEPALRGANGAVSWPGLAGGFMGAWFIAAFCPLLGLGAQMSAVAAVGFGGCLLDSIIGDTLEAGPNGKGLPWVGNDLVNLAAAISAAVAAYFLAAA
jgi:uncharacterized protein (TIGR00297 family)